MSIEAMKRALEALEHLGNQPDAFVDPASWNDAKAKDACIALRTAIQQAESEPVEISPEFTDTARAALLWVLWHHHGGSSPVGQPIRYALGMGAHDHLNDHQVIEAKRWASITGAQTSEFHTHPAPGVPEFSRIAKRKLDELQEQGFAITGYAIQRGPVRGFIDGGGFVGWWQGEPDPGVPDDVARDAERWRTFLATRPSSTHEGIIAAIDAASPAQKGGE